MFVPFLSTRCLLILLSDPKARPSAAELRKHPYLVTSLGWVFDPAEIEGEKRSVWRSPSTTKLSDRGSTRGLPPVPQRKAYDSSATVLPYQPTPTTNSTLTSTFLTPQTSNGADHSTYRTPVNNALPPPIVYITPPSSPVKQSHDRYSVSNSSPPASESTRTSTTRKKSLFYVVNPDPEEDDIPSHLKRLHMEPYVYNPPPLPNTSRELPPRLSTSQSMSQLSSPQAQHIRSPSQSSSPSSSSTSTYVSSIHSSSLPPMSRTARSDDSDSDGGASDGGTWQKPPVDIYNLAQRAPSPRQSRRISIVDRKRESAWARPVIEDVYQHMDEFFPDHDIDKPIIGAGPAEASRAKRKTIRMVAEERLQGEDVTRIRRRGTKLWGSHTHEVKAP